MPGLVPVYISEMIFIHELVEFLRSPGSSLLAVLQMPLRSKTARTAGGSER